jgi:hypothetical protein
MSNNRTWHFGSHRSPQGLGHSCSQPFFVLGQRSRQRTALCKDVEWHILGQECPQSSLDEHLLAQPPSGASLAKSSGTETSMGVSLCRGQHSARLGPILFERSRMESTSAHMGTGLELSELPMMYIPCRARLSSTLMRLEVFKNPHFALVVRTKETTMTFASSPWKLSTVAILKALSSVVFWTWTWPSAEVSGRLEVP